MSSKKIIFIFTILLICLFLYIFIFPLLLCPNLNFDLAKNPKHITCEENSDCISKSCGCLTKKGGNTFNFLTGLCGIRLKCIAPQKCICQNHQCKEKTNDINKDIKENIAITTEKNAYLLDEKIKVNIANNSGTSVWYNRIYPSLCAGDINLLTLWGAEEDNWEQLPLLSENSEKNISCLPGIYELTSKDNLEVEYKPSDLIDKNYFTFKKYRLQFKYYDGEKDGVSLESYSNEFEIESSDMNQLNQDPNIDNEHLDCLSDDQCAVTNYPANSCCAECAIYPIDKEGLELQNNWRNANCQKATCKEIECLWKNKKEKCEQNKCSLIEYNAATSTNEINVSS